MLGPFQGTLACERIALGKGVVGICFVKNETIVVEDVNAFPGYICCDVSASAEICVPLRKEGAPFGVLDIDYPKGHSFKGEKTFYEEVARIISDLLR